MSKGTHFPEYYLLLFIFIYYKNCKLKKNKSCIEKATYLKVLSCALHIFDAEAAKRATIYSMVSERAEIKARHLSISFHLTKMISSRRTLMVVLGVLSAPDNASSRNITDSRAGSKFISLSSLLGSS